MVTFVIRFYSQARPFTSSEDSEGALLGSSPMSFLVLTAGPFCSEHYIGYIPLEIYRNASAERGGAGRVLVKQQL